MPVLHDETRARWEQYTPEQFIRTVLNGALREKVNTAYMVIHVYAQIIHQLPATAAMRLDYTISDASGETDLRELFVHMRDRIAVIHEGDKDETPTQPTKPRPDELILHTVHHFRKQVSAIQQDAEAILAHPQIAAAVFPELKSKRVGDIAGEILKHVHEISQLLDFAQHYAENLTSRVRTSK